MELNVQLNCSHAKNVQHFKMTVDDWDSKCVKELKEILENVIQVPACDQELHYQGRLLQNNDNFFPLKKLYLRKGDTILVKCIAQGDLAEVKSLIEEIKEFSNAITSEDQSELLTVTRSKKHDSSSYVNYDYIARSLDQLSFEYFIPWKNARSVVNRHYFVQEGGFDAFMEVLKFAGRRYKIDTKPGSKKMFGKSKVDETSLILSGQLKSLNIKQMILHMHCLSLLWNFSETLHDRRLVMHKGGLPFVIKALLSDPFEYFATCSEYWEVARINETAVGCLVQYAEFPDCQEVIARSSETVDKLMFMVGNSPLESGPVDTTYSKYSAQIAANTLFCCACSLQTPKILAESGMHKKMINLIELSVRDDLALSYYCTLFLARIRSSALVCLDPQIAKSIDDLITSFLQRYNPIHVSQWEEHHNYVWVTMIPFVSLAFSGRKFEAELQSSDLHKSTEELCRSEYEVTSLAEQEKTDGPNFIPPDHSVVLGKNDEKQGQGKPVFSENDADVVDKREPENASYANGNPQCLVSDEASCQSTMVGSTQTQQLGIFTVKHILYSNENRQLVEHENLLPYLNCLCWHVNPEEGRLLRHILTKYWSPRPAPLKIICKSILAFVCGFESALKM